MSGAVVLFNGLIVTPLQMSALVLMPLPISGLALFNALAALAVATFVMEQTISPGLMAFLKLAYALAGRRFCIHSFSFP